MSVELTEAEIEKLNRGRLLRDASSELIPLLAAKRTQALARLITHFRAGELAMLTPLAAELSVLAELEGNILRSNKETAYTEGKLYESAKPESR